MKINIEGIPHTGGGDKHHLKFKSCMDCGSYQFLLSKKLNNGDWDYWFAIKITDLREYLSDEELKNTGNYDVSLEAVSFEAAGEKNLNSAIESCGFDENTIITDELKIEALLEYGIFATLWNAYGNNLKELKHEALRQADICEVMFGFAMDKPENRIGNTGWDFISGDIGFK